MHIITIMELIDNEYKKHKTYNNNKDYIARIFRKTHMNYDEILHRLFYEYPTFEYYSYTFDFAKIVYKLFETTDSILRKKLHKFLYIYTSLDYHVPPLDLIKSFECMN